MHIWNVTATTCIIWNVTTTTCIISIHNLKLALSNKLDFLDSNSLLLLLTSYDGHIHLLGYPFLDSKEEYVHDSLAQEVMHPRSNEAPISVVDLSTSTVGSLQQLLSETDYFGYPCVQTSSSQLLVGFVSRKDLEYVIGE